MKLLLLLSFICLDVSAYVYGQTITLQLQEARLEKVFEAIEKQSPYHFIYAKEELTHTKAVSVHVTNASLSTVLDLCLKGQPLIYSLKEPYIIIQRKEHLKTSLSPHNEIILKGKIITTEGEAIAGATVAIKGSTIATASNGQGEWVLSFEGDHTTLIVSSIGYANKEVVIGERKSFLIELERVINSLDETVVIAYGVTTRRLITGNVARVSAAEISRQPVSNPLATLQGRVPGLEIVQNSGVPGAGFTIQLRGLNSLTQGTDPLFIIDGIPFGNGNKAMNQLATSAVGGLSPFNTLNPADIESIEVLKDADATAIYGSRGANGVILITTKKGKAGTTKISSSYKSGFSKAPRSMDLLNIHQYLAMRREAFANDGIIPTVANAPDLLVWDTSKTHDYKKMFSGGTAHTMDVQVSVSGGSAQTQFLVNLGYNRETGLLSTTQSSSRKSIHVNFNHSSADRRFYLQSTTGYSYTSSNLLNRDLASLINIAPHFPLYDSAGHINWMSGNATLASYGLTNPLAHLQRKYFGQFQNLTQQLQISYKILPALTVRMSGGFQIMNSDETNVLPKASLDPSSTQLASANFGNATVTSWQAEPQTEYNGQWGHSKLTVLMGATLQQLVNKSNSITAINYSSDLLLSAVNAAGDLIANNDYTKYKYIAGFGRITYHYKQRYLLNLTGRRDGSSRFGPGKRFSNFGAVGAGWIFSAHEWFQQRIPFISFGKIRSSYGITGNDQIGDYRFIDTWINASGTYQGSAGLQPTRLFSPAYSWEKNTKWEGALDLGFIKNRILLSTVYFINRSGNQLVNFSLPIQTGFTSVQQNFGALIQNSGFEISLQTRNIVQTDLQWSSSLQLTIPRNKLIAFEGIENTSYRSLFLVGQPITLKRTYHFTGIHPTTGIYQFTDVDNNGVMDNNDRATKVNVATKFYGGLSNSVVYKSWQLDIFAEFKKQTGRNYLATQSSLIPGYYYYNQPVLVLNRWQKPGDNSLVQRFVASSNSPAFQPAQSWLANSDAIYSDASFIRIKNVSLSYSTDLTKKEKGRLRQLSAFVQAQNLFTYTRYIGADPENQSLYVLPPMKAIVLGLSIQF